MAEMKRMTYRLEDQWGNETDKVIFESEYIYWDSTKKLEAALSRLAEIEDIIADEDGNYNLDRLTKIMKVEKQRSEMLKTGATVYYVDAIGEIERGVVTSVCYDKGRLESFGVEFPESNDFDEFFGSAWGDCFFGSEEEALDQLRERNMEELEVSVKVNVRKL